MTRIIAVFFGAGLLRPAPGTWGSLAAVLTGYIIALYFAALGLAVGSVLALLIGWWATAIETRGKDDHDPSEIVIDEVAGQWLALAPVAYFIDLPTALWSPQTLWWLAAFGLFRLFDITKPGPVGWADRRGDAWGVMLDDVIAGAIAAVLIVAAAVLLF